MTDENQITAEGNSESTPEALTIAAENVVQDVKEATPGIIAHLEAWGEIAKEDVEKAIEWLKSKL